MAEYTVQLNTLISSNFDLDLMHYPIFDEAYRTQLNTKILNHYRFREIGFETAAMFKYYLNVRLNEIMPLFNQQYKSTLIAISPLLTQKFTDNTTKNNSDSSTIAQSGVTHNTATDVGTSETIVDVNGTDNATDTIVGTLNKAIRHVKSDTPQAILSMSDIENELYASGAELGTDSDTENNTKTHSGSNGNNSEQNVSISNTNTNNGTNTINTTNEFTGLETYAKTLTGYSGISESELLLKFRETFINVDMEIIHNLKDLFMNLF